ncbi:SdiA-regulated domain-containing protein, partial [Pseudomonas viridiflava]|uniref:SdiA-regulated domain-containing protein n=1 Tax=Pseudomonas viridiflava TaxID=33069 RepID=UPI001980FA3B
PGPLRLQVRTDPERDKRLFLTDLSSLYYDVGSQHLWALSDESKMVVELDQKGEPLSSLNLRAGNQGLKADIPQAEGMAMGSNGDLFLVSEPNLFYRFKKSE